MSRAVKSSLVVVLITALRDEYEQLLTVEEGSIDDSWQEGPGLDDRLVGTRRFRASNGSDATIKIIATWATEMGSVATAALATSLIDKYYPHCVSMCGICAGRQGKVSLGDVIFADRLWSYDTGKLVVEVGHKGERVERFSGDMFQYRLPERWKQRLEAYRVGERNWLNYRPLPLEAQSQWLLKRLLEEIDPQSQADRKRACPDWADTISFLRQNKLIKRSGLSLTPKGASQARDLALVHLDGLPEPQEFRVHLAPVATGNQVVEDPQIFERLSLSMRKVLGLEMEASALGAVGDLKELPVIVAKGVSDFAGHNKDDRFRKFAARASAECLIGFLRANLPALLRPLRTSRLNEANNEVQRDRPNLLPRDVATFTGRTVQIKRLVKDLTPKSVGPLRSIAVTIDAIDGMAGIGKTALAVHLAHLLTPHYPDAQLFIELHGYTPGREPVTPAAALDRLLRSLGVAPAKIPEDIDERAALWRREIAGLRTLVILDNANSHEQVRALLPGVPGCCVLITSRRRLTGLEGVRQLSLDVLPEKEAVSLFRRILGVSHPTVNSSAIVKVVRLCGHLPLAIQLVASRWRNRPAWTIGDLMEQLTNARTRLKFISAESIEIVTAFELSYIGLSGHQKRLFRRLGLHPGSDVTPETAATLINQEVGEVERRLDELFDHSLINEPERGRYRFHDLLRDYARERATQEESSSARNSAQHRLLNYYVQSLDFADRILDPHRRRINPIWPKTTTRVPHIESHRDALQWLEAERLNALACVRLAVEMGENLIVWQFGDLLAQFLLHSGYNSDAFELHQAAWAATKDKARDGFAASALTNLAQTCQATGKFDLALEYYRQALDLWLYAQDDEGRATTLTGIGFTLERTGQYREALARLDEALRIRRAKNDNYGEAHVLNASGAVYWRLHEYPKALRNFRTALLIRKKIKDRYGEGKTVNNIGFTYHRLGEHVKAKKWLLDALAIAHDLGDRNGEAVTLNNLGYTLERGGDFSGGLDYAKRGLDTARIMGSLYEEGRALDAMARCELGRGDRKTAKQYWNAAIRLFDKAGVPEAQDLRLTWALEFKKEPKP